MILQLKVLIVMKTNIESCKFTKIFKNIILHQQDHLSGQNHMNMGTILIGAQNNQTAILLRIVFGKVEDQGCGMMQNALGLVIMGFKNMLFVNTK